MKKVLISLLLVVSVLTLSACGSKKYNIADYLIEERENLFVAEDKLYSATFSSGMREENYSMDGIKNNMIPFGIITLSRLDNDVLAHDTYTYALTINDDTYSGFLEASNYDNTYSIDTGVKASDDANITLKVTFTGYAFNQTLANVSSEFNVDKNAAIEIANKELKDNIKNIMSEKGTNCEAVIKILKDYSDSELKCYYWYIGIISTSGDTLGILIDATNGNIIAKKV